MKLEAEMGSVIVAILVYVLGMSIMFAFGSLMASITGNSDWNGIGACLGFVNPLIFAGIYFIGKLILESLKKK